MADSFAHAQPWWFLLAALPALTFPWIAVPALWRAGARHDWGDPASRLCLIWAGSALLAFSMMSGKQAHYLVPELPAAALVVARLSRARFALTIPAAVAAAMAVLGAAAAAGLLLLGRAAALLEPRSTLLAWAFLTTAVALTALRLRGLAGGAVLTLGTVLAVDLLLGLTAAREAYDTHRIAAAIAPHREAGNRLLRRHLPCGVQLRGPADRPGRRSRRRGGAGGLADGASRGHRRRPHGSAPPGLATLAGGRVPQRALRHLARRRRARGGAVRMTGIGVDLSLVVPARDEVAALGPLIAEIDAALRGRRFEAIVVDDGSTDGTPETLAALAARHPWLRWRRNEACGGQSAAIRQGVRAARGALVVTLDGDGQNPPDQIPLLLAPFEAADADPGLGLVQGERMTRRDVAARRWASRAANAIRQALLRDGVRDSGCGMKAFRREAYLDLPWFDHIHRFMAAMMLREGWRVATVPVAHRARRGGASKYDNLGRALAGIPDLLGAAWLVWRAGPARHPAPGPARPAPGSSVAPPAPPAKTAAALP